MIRQHISGAVLGVLAVLGYALLTEDQPIVSYSRTYSTLEVQAGDVVQVSASVARDKACSSRVQRDWYDATGNLLSTVIQDHLIVSPPGEEQYTSLVTIPRNALPGKLRQRVRATFYCNWAQRLLGIGSDFVLPDVIFHVKP